MTCFFHIIFGLAILVLQTTILPDTAIFSSCYDLLIVQVVYLGLHQKVRESIIVIVLLGIAADSLTGGPYGVYLTTYFWLFISVRWALVYLRLSNTIILPFVVAYGVLIENLLQFAGAFALDPSNGTIVQMSLHILTTQLLWAIFTGPIFLRLLSLLHGKLQKLMRRMVMVGTRG
ncbi:MAG: hypothetical protein DSY89_00625 [Deltaproteobacteria bacterium]|nr:MAG: hypothetical protein DSY89_00625 [Deltaproteobacteria bacterium]